MGKGFVNKQHGAHWFEDLTSKGMELVENDQGVLTSTAPMVWSVADLQLPLGPLRAGVLGIARFIYDVTGGDSGAEGAFNTGVGIPDNAVIIGGLIDVLATFTGASGDDGMTIGVSVQTAGDIVAAIAISDSGNPWDLGLHAVIPVFSAASALKLTANRTIMVNVDDPDGSHALTAGKLIGFLVYLMSA